MGTLTTLNYGQRLSNENLSSVPFFPLLLGNYMYASNQLACTLVLVSIEMCSLFFIVEEKKNYLGFMKTIAYRKPLRCRLSRRTLMV